ATGTAKVLTGPVPCGDSSGPQTQDDNCGAGTCNAGCTGAACVSHDTQGRCIDAKGGISQLCCSNNTGLPCFPTKGGGQISRTGTPVIPGDTTGGVFAGTFCIAHTDSGLINQVTGLPGPGALLLPSTAGAGAPGPGAPAPAVPGGGGPAVPPTGPVPCPQPGGAGPPGSRRAHFWPPIQGRSCRTSPSSHCNRVGFCASKARLHHSIAR